MISDDSRKLQNKILFNIEEKRKQQNELILKGMCPYCEFKMKKDGDGFWCCKCNWAITAKGLRAVRDGI